MSYKIDLSDLRATSAPVTAELLQRFSSPGSKGGLLEPGERLPATRDLATGAGVNPMTAARSSTGAWPSSATSRPRLAAAPSFARCHPMPPTELDDEVADGCAAEGHPRSPANGHCRRRCGSAGREDIVSLAIGGCLLRRAFPVADLTAAAVAVFGELGPRALPYTDVEGLPELREQLALLGESRGFAAGAEEILVTTGARQGSVLVARALLTETDVVCVESPAFAGTLVSLEASGARLMGDPHRPERSRPRRPSSGSCSGTRSSWWRCSPLFQNPTGLPPFRGGAAGGSSSWRVSARSSCSRMASTPTSPSLGPRQRRCAPRLRPISSIRARSRSPFSGGGLRVGWIAARGPVFDRLVALKMASDLNTSARSTSAWSLGTSSRAITTRCSGTRPSCYRRAHWPSRPRSVGTSLT